MCQHYIIIKNLDEAQEIASYIMQAIIIRIKAPQKGPTLNMSVPTRHAGPFWPFVSHIFYAI